MLGLYSATQCLAYPLVVIAAITFNWWIALLVFSARLLLQAFIYFRTMRKLNEADLFPMFLFYELFMCVYYVIFFPALFKKPKKSWK